jgi:hypothetical protein
MTAGDMKEMLDLIGSTASPMSLLILVGVFGFAPVFTVRIFVLLYPPGHPRRAELIAELYTLKRIPRVFYAAEVAAAAVVEGVAERIKARRLLPAELRILHGRLWKARLAALAGASGSAAALLALIIWRADLHELAVGAAWCWFVIVPQVMNVLMQRVGSRVLDVDAYEGDDDGEAGT